MQIGSRRKRRLICGDEQDACTPWKRVLLWHAGERRQTKRKINKRERREARYETELELRDATGPDVAGELRPA
jgi:hypothetical protein